MSPRSHRESRHGIDVNCQHRSGPAVKSCPVYGGKVKLRFRRIRNQPSVIGDRVPGPDASDSGPHFSGGVAVIAELVPG